METGVCNKHFEPKKQLEALLRPPAAKRAPTESSKDSAGHWGWCPSHSHSRKFTVPKGAGGQPWSSQSAKLFCTRWCTWDDFIGGGGRAAHSLVSRHDVSLAVLIHSLFFPFLLFVKKRLHNTTGSEQQKPRNLAGFTLHQPQTSMNEETRDEDQSPQSLGSPPSTQLCYIEIQVLKETWSHSNLTALLF